MFRTTAKGDNVRFGRVHPTNRHDDLLSSRAPSHLQVSREYETSRGEAAIVGIAGLSARRPETVESQDIQDERVVALALADLRHFGLLYERYAERLYWYASVRTGSASIADDVVGETMVTVIEQLHRFDERRGSFASWLFAIAHRKIIDHHRYHQRLRRFLIRSGRRLELAPEEDALDRVLRHEQSGELYAALLGLRVSDQNIIALRYSAELRSSEIAEVLGITPAAARKRLSRAIECLEERLRDGGRAR